MQDSRSIRFGRCYDFTSAHRLHAKSLSQAENVELYGKCNNEAGHGHNYRLTVVVSGQQDPQTGMVINMVELDAIVEAVVDELDYKHLDKEVSAFEDLPSTAENIVAVLWDKVNASLQQQHSLDRMSLSETRNNAAILTRCS